MSYSRYTEGFEIEAVRQVVDRSRSVGEVASRFSVSAYQRISAQLVSAD